MPEKRDLFTTVQETTVLSNRYGNNEDNLFILPKIPATGKVMHEPVTNIVNSKQANHRFAPLGVCMGKVLKKDVTHYRPIAPKKRPASEEFWSPDGNKSKIPKCLRRTGPDAEIVDDETYYGLIKVNMPISPDRAKYTKPEYFQNNTGRMSQCNEKEETKVETIEHLLILTAKALLSRMRMVEFIPDTEVGRFKVLINEHLGQMSCDDRNCDTVPLEYDSSFVSRYSNLCLACGINGVVDIEELCCPDHNGSTNKPFIRRSRCRDKRSTKNALIGGLCFHCTFSMRINRMTLIATDKGGIEQFCNNKAFCRCSRSHYFQKMMLLGALSLNHSLYAPMIINKALTEMIEMAFNNLYQSKRRGKHSWEYHAYVSLIAKNLIGHFASCQSRASQWFIIIMHSLAEGLWDPNYEQFLEKMNEEAIKRTSDCSICCSPMTFENLFRIGSSQLPYHMQVSGGLTVVKKYYNDFYK